MSSLTDRRGHAVRAGQVEPVRIKADPVLVGAEAIGRYLGLTARQVTNMRDRAVAENRPPPYGKIPGLGVAVRVSALDRWIEEHGA
jgi:hypothetical protein